MNKKFKLRYKNKGRRENPIALVPEFKTREEAISFIKRNLSIHPELFWEDIYEVFEFN